MAGADPEDRDEYRADNVFWVPMEARWTATGDVKGIQDKARDPRIGKFVDDAMEAIEKENPGLKRVLPKDYASPDLDKTRLGELIDLISTIGMGDEASRSKDILGRIYEYFLGKFANAEGKGGGEFYTPRSVVKLLVEMIEPYKGRVYDHCCGNGGMFVQSEKFVQAHGGKPTDISIFGQESNPTTWRLCKMNLTIRGIHHLLLTSRFRSEVTGYTNGITVNMLPAEGLKRPRLVLPPAELIRRFTDFVMPLIDKAEANYEESRSLTVTRDALLPKLLSGEISIEQPLGNKP